MKLKFKVQPYQTNAVEAVVDCFAGQPKVDGLTYRIDPGQKAQAAAFEEGFKNSDFALSEAQILENIQAVQRRQNLSVAQRLDEFMVLDRNNQRVPAPATYRRDALAATRVHLSCWALMRRSQIGSWLTSVNPRAWPIGSNTMPATTKAWIASPFGLKPLSWSARTRTSPNHMPGMLKPG
ncbi:hypothetical protein [Novosphingobium sp.]|uniref:hypothetical protein n=1 Tax=Novosphingobium sp. TaxID=1874826 RepID=UPI0035B1012C